MMIYPIIKLCITWAIVSAILLVSYTAVRLGLYIVVKKLIKIDSLETKILLKPISCLFWIFFFYYTCVVVISGFDLATPLVTYLANIRNVLMIAVMAWLCMRLWRIFESHYLSKRIEKPCMTLEPLRKVVHGIIWFVALLISLEVFHVGLGSLLTIGGLSGLAISLAATDPIKNFFGGVTIYLMRSFHIGDEICIKNSNLSGQVEYIGWCMTRLITETGSLAIVPNSIFTNAILINKNISRQEG